MLQTDDYSGIFSSGTCHTGLRGVSRSSWHPERYSTVTGTTFLLISQSPAPTDKYWKWSTINIESQLRVRTSTVWRRPPLKMLGRVRSIVLAAREVHCLHSRDPGTLILCFKVDVAALLDCYRSTTRFVAPHRPNYSSTCLVQCLWANVG